MIRDLARGGCYRIQLGIESGTERVLNSYGKNSTPEEIFEVVKMCRDAGIEQIFGNIILGGAHFSREIFEQDKKFALDLLKESQGTVEIGTLTFWPLAETRMTRDPKNFGIKIIDPDFLTAVGDFPQIETAELDRFDLNIYTSTQFSLDVQLTDFRFDLNEILRREKSFRNMKIKFHSDEEYETTCCVLKTKSLSILLELAMFRAFQASAIELTR